MSVTLDTDQPIIASASEKVRAFLLSPALVLLLSTNIVNVGNLVFNVLFSRLLGPDLFSDLALLLTVKLSILCVLSAVQFEIASRVAKLATSQQRYCVDRDLRSVSKILFFAIACCVFSLMTIFWLLFQGSLGFVLANGESLDRYLAFMVFVFAIPFMAPLCLTRGFCQGRMDLKHIVFSAQIEMVVRLFGAILAWILGAGLPGISLAIVLSIVAGWWFAAPRGRNAKFSEEKERLLANIKTHQENPNPVLGNSLLLASLPWAALQLGQVIALDGDFLAIKFLFGTQESGQAAVAVLVQRILFFGSFGLAAAMLPMAASATSRTELIKAVKPIIVLFATTMIPVMALLSLFPDLFVAFAFGDEYEGSSKALVYSCLSGVAFVVIYLVSTLFMATSRPKIGYAVLGFSVAQLLFLICLPLLLPGIEALTLIKIKAILLSVLCIIFLTWAWNAFSRI
ncbi:MAG: hypothetical protein AAF217_08985 [Pseudomonadota bacterium]